MPSAKEVLIIPYRPAIGWVGEVDLLPEWDKAQEKKREKKDDSFHKSGINLLKV